MKTTAKTMSAVTWIAIQAESAAASSHFFAGETAARIMSAAHVSGTRTEDEWNDLYAAAREAEVTMKDAANPDFGED